MSSQPPDRAALAPLEVGAAAPDFELKDQEGYFVRLSEVRLGARAVVVFFYPRDNSPGCRREVCAFKQHYWSFVRAGARVLGVGFGSERSHQSFASRFDLPFRLLSDDQNQVRERYCVPKTLGLFPGRVTYVINSKGVIVSVIDSQIRPRAHAIESLKIVRELNPQAARAVSESE